MLIFVLVSADKGLGPGENKFPAELDEVSVLTQSWHVMLTGGASRPTFESKKIKSHLLKQNEIFDLRARL